MFDIEIIILIPFIFNLFSTNSLISIFLIYIFLLILVWGLMHEWFLGSLNWM